MNLRKSVKPTRGKGRGMSVVSRCFWKSRKVTLMEESAILLILKSGNILFCLNAGVAVDGVRSLGKHDLLVFICCQISL